MFTFLDKQALLNEIAGLRQKLEIKSRIIEYKDKEIERLNEKIEQLKEKSDEEED